MVDKMFVDEAAVASDNNHSAQADAKTCWFAGAKVALYFTVDNECGSCTLRQMNRETHSICPKKVGNECQWTGIDNVVRLLVGENK